MTIKERKKDIILDKYTRRNITAWGTFTDYMFVLKDFGELEVGRQAYLSYSIGEAYEFYIKRRKR